MSHVTQVSCIPPLPHGRQRRINNRNSRASESKASSSLECSAECIRESTKLTFCCVKHSQLCCVKTIAILLRQILTSNPFRGEFSCQREQSIKLA